MRQQYIDISVSKLPIRLGQFLKLAEAATSGFEATAQIMEGKFKVNGEVETQRGRKLRESDEVSDGTITWRITRSPEIDGK